MSHRRKERDLGLWFVGFFFFFPWLSLKFPLSVLWLSLKFVAVRSKMTKLSAAASEQELLKLGITTQKEPVGASGI